MSDYAPMFSSHGHQRKTHVAESGGASLCGIENRYPDLPWNQGVAYYDIESQFFIDADGHGCERCRKAYRKVESKSDEREATGNGIDRQTMAGVAL